MMLILGVLVALTPCNACQKGEAQGSQTVACHMSSAAHGMGCCHGKKSPSPLCKVMDQSSLKASGVHFYAAVVPAISFAGAVTPVLRTVEASHQPLFDTSPPKPLILRI